MSKEPIYYLNGIFLKKSRASISVNDLGFLRGYGVFDFFITYNNKPFLVTQHLKRLRKSAQLIGMTVPWTNRSLEKLIRKTIAKNNSYKEKSIKIIVSGGNSPDGITPAKKPTLAILVNPRHKPDRNLYMNGAKAITVDVKREVPYAKTLNYTNAVYSMIKARKAGAVEAIYTDRQKDIVLEGTRTNIFAVKNNIISTPETEVLSGITRNLVIEIAKRKNNIKIKNLRLSKLYLSDEAFITASNKEILPIVKIDNKKIGSGKPGTLTIKLMDEFRKYVESDKWS